MPRKPILSPTRIRTYLECPVEYRYTYIDRIGRFYRKPRAEYSFGSTLHLVLQTYHAEGASAGPDELAALLSTRWISVGYETRDQEQTFREIALGIVRAYPETAQRRAHSGITTVATEQTLRADLGRFLLGGRIDRLDRHADGTLEIVDYKSGRGDVSSEEVAADLAMRCYLLALRRANRNTRTIATIHCLRTGASASAEMDDRTAEEFAGEVTTLGEEILDRDLEGVEPEPIEACEWCDFRPRCEQFWRRRG